MGLVVGLAAGLRAAPAPAAGRLEPNLGENIERPLRYRPDGGDFVIENGAEFFNRPLYGGNTAFRVDGGDKPEFVLYLPGRGGNLRLGVLQVERADPSALAAKERVGISALYPAKWLHAAAAVTTRYRPGELLYEIRDPLLGPAGLIRLAVVAWHQTEGLGVRVEGEGLAPGLELVWAYGGVNGQRGTRDGDIGTEQVPISEWFQLQPDFCRDNTVELNEGTFTLRAKAAIIAGVVPAATQLATADASHWNDLPALLRPDPDSFSRHPIVVGRIPLVNNQPLFLSLQRLALPEVERADASVLPPEKRAEVSAFHLLELPQLFAATEAHFAALRGRVAVDTPDPFLNAAVGALNVAADAVWDEPQQDIMHGAIAWRTRLLGWRGPYALDALGWHDRARKHFEYWATRQNTDSIPDKLPPPDEKSNLTRNEAALHSNGDISNSHYDMNLVFIDALFRHLLWTGDSAFAKRIWPVIERHLAWERRLFRREFRTLSGEKLPLYEAYAAIWASDDLQYGGGGTAHASAYNYWHHRMAARLAPLAGADPAPYREEADLIAKAVRQLLWTGDHFGESKDWLGLQLVHPSTGLWTFYHLMDAGLPDPTEEQALAGEVLRRPMIPLRGAGVPVGPNQGMRPTTDWLPYTWSLNNVVMGENVHMALGLWQAGRSKEAYALLRSSLLASMFMGISPGNVGSMNSLDVHRRESQRDFADGVGITARAVVEGLFGLRPDALAGELTVAPGWPAEWTHARISHPQVGLDFRREGRTEHYTISPRLDRPVTLRLRLPLRGLDARVEVNGQPEASTVDNGRLVLDAPAARSAAISIVWIGESAGEARPPDGLAEPALAAHPSGGRVPPPPAGSQPETVDLTGRFNDRVTAIFQPGKYRTPRSPFVSLSLPSQGIGYWAGHVNATVEIDDAGLRTVAARNGGRLVLPNGVPFATPGPGDARNILFTSQWDNYPHEATVPLTGKARQLFLLMAGSTNAMQSRLDNGEVIVTYADGTASRLALRNPETWWPIEQDYFTDDYQFRIDGPLPTRVDLRTGAVRVLEAAAFRGKGGPIPGGAATVLELDLDPARELKSLTVRALANDVVIGLMAATLER